VYYGSVAETEQQLFLNWNVCSAATIEEPDAQIPDFKKAQWNPNFYIGMIRSALRELGADTYDPDPLPVTMTVQEVPVGDHKPGTVVPEEPGSFAAQVKEELGLDSLLVTQHPNHVLPGQGMLAAGIFYSPELRLRLKAKDELPYPTFTLKLPKEDVRGVREADRFDKYVLVAERVVNGSLPSVYPPMQWLRQYFRNRKEQKNSQLDITWWGQPENYVGIDRQDGAKGSQFAAAEEQCVINLASRHRNRPLVISGDLNTPNAEQAFPKLFKALGLQDPLADAGPTRARGTRTVYILVNNRVEVLDGGVYQVPEADHHIPWVKARV